MSTQRGFLRTKGADTQMLYPGVFVALALMLTTGVLSGCYSYQWTASKAERGLAEPPAAVAKIFEAAPGGTLVMELEDPGWDYPFDPGEKDVEYAADEHQMRFRRVEMRLHDRMPPGQVLVDISFIDDAGTKVEARTVDLMRLVPRIDLPGEMQKPELLLEEYGRFGVTFRREHDEFKIDLAEDASPEMREAAGRVYRLGVFNNCLDPTKWEMTLTTEDYSDFDARLESDLYLNQNRTLSHSWFYLDQDLYMTLMRLKNPDLEIDPALALDYMKLAEKVEDAVIDFDRIRKVRGKLDTHVIEIGHQTGRKIEPIVSEQYYKWDIGLFVNRDRFETYADLTKEPVKVAQFADRGFYQPDHPKVFDYWWTRKMDRVSFYRIDQPDSDCYVEIVLDGEELPFKLTLGNLDMAMLNEQQFLTFGFGFNSYPKARRYNPVQSTIAYDPELRPDRIKPYLFLTDKETGHFVNNINYGVEKVYIGWESIEKNVLEIYLLSYERITPIWMARVQISDAMADMIRVRRNMYNY